MVQVPNAYLTHPIGKKREPYFLCAKFFIFWKHKPWQSTLVSLRTSGYHRRPQALRNYLPGQKSFRMKSSQGSTEGSRRQSGCWYHLFPSWIQNHRRPDPLGQSPIGRWQSRVSNEGFPNLQAYRNRIEGLPDYNDC